MSLRGRLNRLEHAPRRPGGCEICGVDPNAPIRYEVIWPEDDEASEEPAVSSPPCPRCGYRAVWVLGWEDLITTPEQAQAERDRRAEAIERQREYQRTHPEPGEAGKAGAQVPDYPPSEDGLGEGSSL